MPESGPSMNPITSLTNPRRVGILAFPEVELLDFCGPFEVFSVTRLDDERRRACCRRST
jgi:hypothetical protein